MATRAITLENEAATVSLAQALAARAAAGDVLLLRGPLGAGKSTLARAFIRARARDATLDVPSPSFTLVQHYALDPPVTHVDLWRLTGPHEVAELDLESALEGILLIEWPERLGTSPWRHALRIDLQWADGDRRDAVLHGPERLLE